MLLRSVIVLLIVYLLPMNPFKLLEIPIVAKPKERELRLGVAILERFSELEQSALTLHSALCTFLSLAKV